MQNANKLTTLFSPTLIMFPRLREGPQNEKSVNINHENITPWDQVVLVKEKNSHTVWLLSMELINNNV